MKLLIIGAGGIAKRLRERLQSEDNDVLMLSRKDLAERDFRAILHNEDPMAVFIAISTLDTGEAARDYMMHCIDERIPVITCEKGALAYYSKDLRRHLDRIGHSATVGGGTMMLDYSRKRRRIN